VAAARVGPFHTPTIVSSGPLAPGGRESLVVPIPGW